MDQGMDDYILMISGFQREFDTPPQKKKPQ